MNKLGKKICLWWLVIALFAGSCFAAKRGAQSDVAGVASEERLAGQDKNKRYFLIGGGAQAQAPGEGYGLVVVLPGGDGGADFNDFVRRIYKKSLSEEYLAAELVAVKWTEQQQVVWPTEKAAVEKQGFSTEEFIEAVLRFRGLPAGLRRMPILCEKQSRRRARLLRCRFLSRRIWRRWNRRRDMHISSFIRRRTRPARYLWLRPRRRRYRKTVRL
ncbi:MAG: hypothetical protein ACYST6_08555 [Planctomycetota bacterium]|jgi:hypothetical protein